MIWPYGASNRMDHTKQAGKIRKALVLSLNAYGKTGSSWPPTGHHGHLEARRLALAPIRFP